MNILPILQAATQAHPINHENDKIFGSAILSTNLLMCRLRLTQTSPNDLPSADKLLKKAHYISIFSESDRVHLLQIFQSFTQNFSENEAKGLIEWFKIVKEELGNEVFLYVTNPSCYIGSNHPEVMKCLQQLIEIAFGIEDFMPILVQFYQNQITLKDLHQHIDIVKNEMEAIKYPEKNLDLVIEAFKGNIEGSLISFPLSSDQLSKIKKEHLQIVEMGKELKKGGINKLISFVNDFKIRAKDKALIPEDRLMIIAVGREAIRIKFGIFPYNTQILTVLGLLHYPENCKGRISQVRTGEGKSVIVALLAFYHACQGYAVDVISTTRYLAKRDQEKFAEFFDLFEIPTSSLCSDNPTADNFKGLVIYGTNYDFEFAWMRDQLGQQDIRKLTRDGNVIKRPREIVIVDEVDSLFIDGALNSARIAVDGRAKNNWIYTPILDFVKENQKLTKSAFFTSSSVDEALMLQDKVVQSLKQILINYQGGKFKTIIEKFKSKNIETWICSAYSALFVLERKKDYDVKPIKVSTYEGDIYQDRIVIVDRKNTGTINENCRWHGGMHEFVEVKEQLLPAEENLMPASICHPLYFAGYQTIFGTTGTMGTIVDRQEIQDIYGIDSFDVPPHKSNLRRILEPKIVSEGRYLSALLEDIKFIQSQQRPTLVIFETIKETEEFHDFLKKNNIFSQVLNERQSQHEDFIIAKAGAPAMVTIATNTAGRGTDIILHPTSLKNGGLHMTFGYYPVNERVEMQGFGRAARQGQPGTCRIIHLFKDFESLSFEKSEFSSLSDELEFLSRRAYVLLEDQRKANVKKLAKRRKEKFLIEKINYKYLDKFFAQCQSWQKAISKEFLERACSTLHTKLKDNFSCMISEDPVDNLTSELQKIFIYQSTHDMLDRSWMPFIKGVRSALKTNIQQDWAESFFNELDDLEYNAKQWLPRNETLEVHYENLIEKLFLTERNNWEKHLLEPEQGFYRYLSLICGF